MKNLTQKAAIVFVVFIFSLIVSGNAVFAQNQATGSLISAADLTFVESASKGSVYQYVTPTKVLEAGGLVTGVDLAFIKAHPKAGTQTTGKHETERSIEGMGVITEDDYKYLVAGM